MGFWSAIKRGLGLGYPSSNETRRLQKRQKSSTTSIIASSVGSGSVASSRTARTSITATQTIHPSESGVVVNTPTYYPSLPTVPENIEVIDEGVEEFEPIHEAPSMTGSKPKKKAGFWRRIFKKKAKRIEIPPRAQTSYTIPSTSDLMHGMAPIAPSATDSALLREQVREAMGLPPRPRSDTPSIRSGSEISQVPSQVHSPIHMRESPAVSPPTRRSFDSYTRGSIKPPSPPVPRQTPRLATIDVPPTNARYSPPKSTKSAKTGGLGSSYRKISVREISEDGTNADMQSIAAMSYASRKSKSARIFEVAEVINGPLSPVSEEAAAPIPIGKVSKYGAGIISTLNSMM